VPVLDKERADLRAHAKLLDGPGAIDGSQSAQASAPPPKPAAHRRKSAVRMRSQMLVG
jgi:hypothetical protein